MRLVPSSPIRLLLSSLSVVLRSNTYTQVCISIRYGILCVVSHPMYLSHTLHVSYVLSHTLCICLTPYTYVFHLYTRLYTGVGAQHNAVYKWKSVHIIL